MIIIVVFRVIIITIVSIAQKASRMLLLQTYSVHLLNEPGRSSIYLFFIRPYCLALHNSKERTVLSKKKHITYPVKNRKIK